MPQAEDPSAGRYRVVTNATFDLTEPKCMAGKPAPMKDATGELQVPVLRALDGRKMPTAPVNVFGAAVPGPDGGWVVVPARLHSRGDAGRRGGSNGATPFARSFRLKTLSPQVA